MPSRPGHAATHGNRTHTLALAHRSHHTPRQTTPARRRRWAGRAAHTPRPPRRRIDPLCAARGNRAHTRAHVRTRSQTDHVAKRATPTSRRPAAWTTCKPRSPRRHVGHGSRARPRSGTAEIITRTSTNRTRPGGGRDALGHTADRHTSDHGGLPPPHPRNSGQTRPNPHTRTGRGAPNQTPAQQPPPRAPVSATSTGHGHPTRPAKY